MSDEPCTGEPAVSSLAMVEKPLPDFGPNTTAALVWLQPIDVIDFYAEAA